MIGFYQFHKCITNNVLHRFLFRLFVELLLKHYYYYIIFIATGEPQTNYKNLEKVKDTSVYSLLLVFKFYILYLYFFLRNVVQHVSPNIYKFIENKKNKQMGVACVVTVSLSMCV